MWFKYLYYKGRCLCVCQNSNVPTITSPPILKLWDTQGYLWLSYDLMEVINLIGERFEPKKYFFFKKILYVIHSALVSFLSYYCHSFRIFVIPSEYCHSFQIIVILNSSQFTHIPKEQENWPVEPAKFANIF